jgi:hypothetical protein
MSLLPFCEAYVGISLSFGIKIELSFVQRATSCDVPIQDLVQDQGKDDCSIDGLRGLVPEVADNSLEIRHRPGSNCILIDEVDEQLIDRSPKL